MVWDDPREIALKTLIRKPFLSKFTPPRFKEDRDRAFYQELIRGINRHKLFLDWHIQKISQRPLDKLSPQVLNTLRIGLYQILFLKVPDHAAVCETVQLIKKTKQGHAKGFVNATLRTFLRNNQRGETPKDLKTLYSISPAISKVFQEVLRWAEKEKETQQFYEAFNQPLAISLRINALKSNRDQIKKEISEKNSNLFLNDSPISPWGIKLTRVREIKNLAGYDQGNFIIQSESSQLIAPLLGPFNKPLKILDACAAPGGKTTHLAQMQKDQGMILALSPKRRAEHQSSKKSSLERLKENINRLDLKSIEVIEKTAEEFSKSTNPETFDRILVDAPCTGLGTLAKNPEKKWLFKESHINKLVQQQESILKATFPLLKKGGILVYSVCSMTLPEWLVGINFAKKNGKLLGPPENKLENLTFSWEKIYHPPHQSFIFWPHIVHSEGLFAIRLQKL